ncbi:MAG: multifunctional oxoglutarate decarboxylase/oxoglutarate dehydrogenase thiamine pyrophosphate-binding subunit/dihydrolipoyllysine-residue succinyltransferase subunit, partial [Actinomycetota bacterium]|nr:multifunctional oxoglutarate decarboxylase/oxoglutarate dehydrogenase thiamine pyrophosphate-binding subunit/dihydrolipoyllysine-residue succinyltransferase subunit [Actinomycetota bacterium]
VPHVETPEHVTLGLAVDVARPDGGRTLLVPNIRSADDLDFAGFFDAYEDLIRKVRSNRLTPDDFAGTTATITNPGMIGTVQSVPRLMAGQSVIVGVGAIGYPAEFEGSDPEALADFGVGKVLTLTSTYDHRVIQGAESGEFLQRVHGLLLGEDGFYDQIFATMGVPYVPVRWRRDTNPPRESLEAAEKHGEVLQLINMYRVRGHLIADLDPLDMKPVAMHPELDPATYGLSIWDLDRRFITDGLAGRREATLREILSVLRDAYCRTSTVEYMHIQEPDQKQWIQERMETGGPAVTHEDQLRILSKLGEVEALNEFLHRKYVGHKRFSLEGGDSLIPMLDAILSGAADERMPEAVIGMAHRGRLDVLTAIVGKSFSDLFQEFEGYVPPDMPQGSGDVKYHIGAEGKFTAPSGSQVLVSVASNPSHLESVDPVVEGMVRAKQELLGDMDERYPVLPVLIHGDAAFAGQGVVAETLNLSQLTGFATGGTLHIIVNNQLGFTTGSDYGRSSTYSSDVAKMVQAPIWHVNGDDPEACVRVARLAFEFRQRFHKDVVIDMWCYRRWGHNEGDDPSFTQPLMYRRIRELRSLRKRYVEQLVNRRDLSVDEGERALQEFRERLDRAFEETPRGPASTVSQIDLERPAPMGPAPVSTAVERETLDEIVRAITSVPDGFTPHPKLEKWLEGRRAALAGDDVDWSLAEALAFGSLVREGRTVRLSGQDSRRGTFSQRHSVLVDHRTGREHTPLAALGDGAGAGRFAIYDSLLSEFAVVGFEYGYSVASPDALVLWEAQFGDFINGAQVVVDQFIAGGEDKWGQHAALVLLLPHGFEGQGPEHSSARLERFLELAAEDNMQVVVPSTPAQYFHVLRRQALRERKKPLVVLTPKSLLRLPAARSRPAELTQGRFMPVLSDPEPRDAVRRVILCQGKMYYDLLKARGDAPVAMVRVEEVYPFPAEAVRNEVERAGGAEVVWVQEEPENMGSWPFMDRTARRELGLDLHVVAREPSGSPATGSLTIHGGEQQDLIDRALAV